MANLIEYMVIRWLSVILTSMDPRTANVGQILLGIAMTVFSVWLLRRASKVKRFGMLLFTLIVLVVRVGY